MRDIEWIYKNSQIEPSVINEFSQQFKIGYVFSTILLNRGIKTEEDLKKYFTKSLEFVHNPNLLPDIEAAVKRIKQAIENNEKIVIYGDYDVDGVTAVSILYSFLKEQNADVSYYIPDRMTEGYGLNIKAINKISKLGTNLLITVDCGISSVGEVELAKVQKMDVIITDHHNCKEKLPNALAVINPKRKDSQYPFSDLCGAGVIFKTVLALAKEFGLSTKDCFLKYSPLAAIATIADVVDLKDENRIIVDRGLKSIKTSDFIGLTSLIKIAGVLEKPINTTTVAFTLSPRINAAGRINSALLSCELLLTKNIYDADIIADELNEINEERRIIEKRIYREAVDLILREKDFFHQRIIVLSKEGWHHGVIGIVAAKICEEFNKPTILLSCDKSGVLKGSGRSIDDINLFDSISHCEELLTQFGGHSLAAGLTLEMSNFDEFKKKINEYIKNTYPEMPKRKLSVECSVPPSFITVENAKRLLSFEPFGMANEKPVFVLKNAKVVSCTIMGNGEHMHLIIEAGGKTYKAAGFRLAELVVDCKPDTYIDIAFCLEVNSWRGKENAELIVKDIKFS